MRRGTLTCVFALAALVNLPAPGRAGAPPNTRAGTPPAAPAAPAAPRVYVILWFDTEDYLLPASDDAALEVARFLTKQGIRGTFKVVGEKARTLVRRGRKDVIAALGRHEIGYHSNFHSVQPTPAMYLSNLGWDEGAAEFLRREGAGRDDVERIFGQKPTCYGQPGSSWGPQSYAALRKWDMVYLDAGKHVALDGRPNYYAGVFNLYQLEHLLRADLNDPAKLEEATTKFAAARKSILASGGGVVSTVYHPCEWVHKEFWDGVNFRKGANPPREEWKLPRQKTPDETKLSYRIFHDYIAFMRRFPDVVFVTASEAAELYRDRARGRSFGPGELAEVARRAARGVTFQERPEYALSAAEALLLLNEVVADAAGGKRPGRVSLGQSPIGPTGRPPEMDPAVTADASQFGRTAGDVREYLLRHGRVPSAVWLGSVPVTPEAYLLAVAGVVPDLLAGKPLPARVELKPAPLLAEKYVSVDDPKLWGWVIFPPGFKAPAMMEQARRQAWSLKPALLSPPAAAPAPPSPPPGARRGRP